MKSMVLLNQAPVATNPLRPVEVSDPVPGRGEVRLRVRCCAVCRTDLHIVEGDLPARRLPLVPGHQVVGIVGRLGPGCRRLTAGRRVGVAWLRQTCGTCGFCAAGRENLCRDARFTGYDADGGFAEYAVAGEEFVYEIPEAFGDAAAAPLLCAGIIGYRSLARANPHPGCRLALYGFGSSAHIVIQIAVGRGYEVYVATRGEGHRALARSMGATWVGEHPSEMPVRADSAIIFAPAGDLVPPAMEKLERGGTLAIAGIHMSAVPAMDYNRHLFFERDLRSVTCNTRDDGRRLLEEAAGLPIGARTTAYPLADANRALQDLKADRISGTGLLVIDY